MASAAVAAAAVCECQSVYQRVRGTKTDGFLSFFTLREREQCDYDKGKVSMSQQREREKEKSRGGLSRCCGVD